MNDEKVSDSQKEDPGARKVRESPNSVFCQCFVVLDSRLAKATGAEPSGHMRNYKLHAVVARSTFRSQNVALQLQSTFGRWDVAKVGAHFRFKMCKTHHVNFWKLVCRKSACCCGAEHISKSKPMAGARDRAPWQKWANRGGFEAVSKTMAGIRHLKRIWIDACRVSGALQTRHVHQRC